MNAGVEKNMILKYQEAFDFLKQSRQLVIYVMLVALYIVYLNFIYQKAAGRCLVARN